MEYFLHQLHVIAELSYKWLAIRMKRATLRLLPLEYIQPFSLEARLQESIWAMFSENQASCHR